MAKKLTLKKESLEPLSREQLDGVDGAAATRPCLTLDGCFTHTTTLDCLSRRVCTTTG